MKFKRPLKFKKPVPPKKKAKKKPEESRALRPMKTKELWFFEALKWELRERPRVISSDFSEEQLKLARTLRALGYLDRDFTGWKPTLLGNRIAEQGPVD